MNAKPGKEWPLGSRNATGILHADSLTPLLAFLEVGLVMGERTALVDTHIL